MNVGKEFERDFKSSVPKDYFLIRLRDNPFVFFSKDQLTKNIRFSIPNMCDFILFTGKKLFLLELKTTLGKSLPFSNIKDDQINGMMKNKDKINTFPGLLINFREHNKTFFIQIDEFVNFMNNTSKKSINIDDLEKLPSLKIEGVKKTKRYTYSLKDFK